MPTPIAILIVAGGQSRRMGRDKALLHVGSKTMLDRTIDLARQIGAGDIRVLGRPDHPLGVRDRESHAGPARAIAGWLAENETPVRILALPVDMPLLEPHHLKPLLNENPGAYFDDHYLPFTASIPAGFDFDGTRMRSLLKALNLKAVPVPGAWQKDLMNVNNPEAITAARHRLAARQKEQ